MPRFSIENSSSEDSLPLRSSKRRRLPTRPLYRTGNTSANAVGSTSIRGIDDSDDSFASSAEESVDEESGDEEEEVAVTRIGNTCATKSNGVVGKDVIRSKEGGTTRGPISVTLTDTDVLDCAICFEPFTIPVFQCENGHTACSSCCSKLRNKCPSCCLPIGYNRCRAFEKVLESLKITCLNSKYGCKEKVSYSKKHEHEQSCVYEPCSCPQLGCSFDGSYKDLYSHFASKHPTAATRFKFDSCFSVVASTNMKYNFLQEHDNTLFILNYGVQSIGNVANIICIGPSSLQKEYAYELVASKGDSSVKLNSLTQSMPKWSVHLPQKSILLVPKDFIDSSRVHTIQVCIRRNNEK